MAPRFDPRLLAASRADLQRALASIEELERSGAVSKEIFEASSLDGCVHSLHFAAALLEFRDEGDAAGDAAVWDGVWNDAWPREVHALLASKTTPAVLGAQLARAVEEGRIVEAGNLLPHVGVEACTAALGAGSTCQYQDGTHERRKALAAHAAAKDLVRNALRASQSHP